VAKESAAHFIPGLYLGPMNECLRERVVPPAQFRGPDEVTDRCPPAQADADFYGGPTWPGTAPAATPLTRILHQYGEHTRMVPVVLLIGLVLTLAALFARRRGSGRVRLDLALLTLAGPGLTVLTVAIGMYEPRYALPALPLSAIAAAVAWHGLRIPPPTPESGPAATNPVNQQRTASEAAAGVPNGQAS
jgi:hypothetical protein